MPKGEPSNLLPCIAALYLAQERDKNLCEQMDASNCLNQQLFTDRLFSSVAGECDYSVVSWYASVMVLLITYVVATITAFGKWCRREVRRRSCPNGVKYKLQSTKYICSRRLPVLPSLILGISLTALLFWSLASFNAINVVNGLSVMFYTIHVLAAFVLLHFYLLRFVRIGLRITPLRKQLRLIRTYEQIASSGEFAVPPSSLVHEDTTGLDLPLKIGFGVSLMLTIAASLTGIVGGPLYNHTEAMSGIITSCAITFGVNGGLLIVLFNWQLHRNIVAIESFRRLDIGATAIDESLGVLRQQRFVSLWIMASMTSLSFVLAFIPYKPWWLALVMDYLIVVHTLLLWIGDVVSIVRGKRTRCNRDAAKPASPEVFFGPLPVIPVKNGAVEKEITPRSSRIKIQPFDGTARDSSSPKSKKDVASLVMVAGQV